MEAAIHSGTYILIGIWLLPAALVAMSRPRKMTQAWLWIAAAVCLSWLGWVFFALVMTDD